MGYALRHIVDALGLNSTADLWLALAAFTFAYATFEIPSGWLGDVFGPRRVLIRIVLSWSLFTALTGFVGLSLGGFVMGYWSLVLVRFLFGVGEAGAYPNITRALHNWFPFEERGKAQGSVWMSGRLMGGLTPFIWGLLVSGIRAEGDGQVLLHPIMKWRSAFWLFGGLGIVWCVLFGWWFRNRPEEKKTVNAAELELIHVGSSDHGASHAGVPWKRMLTSGNLWMLCLMYASASYGWYFNITYYPSFLKEQFKVDDGSIVGWLYKGGPLLAGAVACFWGGWLTDWLTRRTGNRKWGRRLFGVIGHGLCALCYLACLRASSAFAFALAISMAAFCNDLTMGAAWATCQDIGKRYAAIVAGCMNMVGNLGGTLANVVTGLVLQSSLNAYAVRQQVTVEQLTADEKVAGLYPGYEINLISFVVVYALAVVFWLRVDASRPVAEPDSGANTNGMDQ
jgi:MFS family permease